MKFLLKVLALGMVLFATVPMAKAATLFGTLDFTGLNAPIPPGATSAQITATQLKFIGQPQTFVGQGDLAAYNGGTVTFNTITLANIAPGTPQTLFTIVSGGNTLSYAVTSYTVSGNTINFVGTLTGTGAGSNPYVTFTLTTLGAPGAAASYVATLASAPEPNSLLLLGTGLMGAAGMAFRKRRAA